MENYSQLHQGLLVPGPHSETKGAGQKSGTTVKFASVPYSNTVYKEWVKWLEKQSGPGALSTTNTAVMQRYLPESVLTAIRAPNVQLTSHADIPEVVQEFYANKPTHDDIVKQLHMSLNVMIGDLLQMAAADGQPPIRDDVFGLYRTHIGTIVQTTVALATDPVQHLLPCLQMLLQHEGLQVGENIGVTNYLDTIALPYSHTLAGLMAEQIETLAKSDSNYMGYMQQLSKIGSDSDNQKLVEQVFARATNSSAAAYMHAVVPPPAQPTLARHQ